MKLLLLITIGCVDIQGPVPPPIEANNVFSVLRFAADAMFIQQGESLPLSLEAIAADGSSISVEMQNVSWVSGDSNRVSVDALGYVIGHTVSSNPVMVTAKYTHASTTRSTTILVYVTSDRLEASSLKLVPLDSTRVGGGWSVVASLPRIRLDLYNGNILVRSGVQLPITAPAPFTVSYVPTGGPSQEPVYVVGNGGSGLKRFWVKGEANLYGVVVRDSVEFTGLYPYRNLYVITGISQHNDGSFGTLPVGGEFLQQPCALVNISIFLPLYPNPVEIVFSDSTAGPDGCDPLPQSTFMAGTQPGIRHINAVGGNVLIARESTDPLPFLWVDGYRRSATVGEVLWYVRDAVTKERLPVEGKFTQRQVQ